MERRTQRYLHHRKQRELEKRREQIQNQAPVRQWQVMPVWILLAGFVLIIGVLTVWFVAFS